MLTGSTGFIMMGPIMSKFKHINKVVTRLDGADKATGALKYPSDLYPEDLIWVRALRAAHPYARILSIDTALAQDCPGVVKVLTHRDIPGENGFGIAIQDQPVLCHDVVRYLGDAVALVGAETKEAAARALELIAVEYEVFEPLTDPAEAMREGAVALHPEGNIHHQGHFKVGDPEQALAGAEVTVEGVYHTPRMDHLPLETEAGISYYDDDGLLTVCAGGQYPFRDRTQVARALGLRNDQVRAICPPVGGAFGGKDEVTVQIHLALMTYHTGRPAKMVFDRRESLISTTKRHPATLRYKIGADGSGVFKAVSLEAVTDAGAYASLSGPVLNLVMEHAGGPYRFPHARVDGYAVYTNNGFSGAFRGFGCTQACLGIETQIDMLAEKLAMDPIALRQMNALEKGDLATLGYEMVTAVGISEVLRATARSELWVEREALKSDLGHIDEPVRNYIRRGVGVAAQMQGCALGVGLPDYAEIKIRLAPNGELTLLSGTVELGQGNITCFCQMAAEELEVEPHSIRYIVGDTGRGPDSGTTTASRTIYAAGNAVILAARDLRRQILMRAAALLGCEAGELSFDGTVLTIPGGKALSLAELAARGELTGVGNFTVPVAEVELGDGLPHILYSYGSHVVMVEVDLLTGEIYVPRVEAYLDAGRVINLQGLEGQSEGGVVQAIGYTLMEEVRIDKGFFVNPELQTYIIPTASDGPLRIDTFPVEVLEPTGPYGAKGISETTTVPVAPAILNALYDAIGIRFFKLPVTPEMVLEALNAKQAGGAQ